MIKRDIVVIGASAGGVKELQKLVSGFAADLRAAVFVVLHISRNGRSMLPEILGRAGPLPAYTPAHTEPVRYGNIYIAPPDHHMFPQNGCIQVTPGPRENVHRPSIDVLFRSASLTYGERVIGVILSGVLADGVAGLKLIKDNGGIAIVQDPDEAEFPDMPQRALESVHADYILKVAEIPRVISQLVGTPQHDMGVPS